MATLKVVVTGPVSAGKTTFIQTLSQEEVVETEASTTDATEKSATTVGLDLGFVDVRGERAKVFGTPGQRRFQYLREVLSVGADGFIFLYPADKTPDLERPRTFIRGHCHEKDIPVVVGVTRLDLGRRETKVNVRERLEPLSTSVESLDARKRDQCLELLSQLVGAIRS